MGSPWANAASAGAAAALVISPCRPYRCCSPASPTRLSGHRLRERPHETCTCVRTRPGSPMNLKDKPAAQRPPAGLGIENPYPPGCEAAANGESPDGGCCRAKEDPTACRAACRGAARACLLHMGRHGTAPGGLLDRDAHLSDAMGRYRAAFCGHRDIPYRPSVPRHQRPAARRQKSCKGGRGVARVENRTIRRHGARS